MSDFDPQSCAIIGDVGRKGVRIALTDAAGQLRTDTIRVYDAASQTTVSGALSTFRRDAGLPALPRRCALSVAGAVRGDTISITNTRWFISRSGLAAMLQQPPVIINDFAAQAWALSGAGTRAVETMHGQQIRPDQPGCYCVLGMTTGLGVAVLVRDAGGTVTVLPTEAGHCGLAPATPEIAALVAELAPDGRGLSAEALISGPGLVAIHRALALRAGQTPRAQTPEDITRNHGSDRLAMQACELLCRTFWSFAGNAVLSFGAWDGVCVTGRLAAALRPILRRADLQEGFNLRGNYQRQLRDVPRALISLDHPELAGAAQALRQVQSHAAPIAVAA